MKTIGILVCRHVNAASSLPFHDTKLYAQFCKAGDAANIAVLIFTPFDLDFSAQQVTAYQYDAKQDQWQRNVYAIPTLIYDKYMHHPKACAAKKQSMLRDRILKYPKIRLLSNQLNSKSAVHHILRSDQRIAPYLPPVEPYTGQESLRSFLQLHTNAVLKPERSSQGKGILFLQQHDKSHYLLHGYDQGGRFLPEKIEPLTHVSRRIATMTGKRPYFMQPMLHLHTDDGEAYDLRLFMQKDTLGRWSQIGSAVRKAAPSKRIANLHAGGKAYPADTFLTRQFGPLAKQMLDTIKEVCALIPTCLESHYGRLLELGIDIGIETNGRIWILEVNSKPGRQIFTHLGARELKKQSIRNPIRYAHTLLDRQLGG